MRQKSLDLLLCFQTSSQSSVQIFDPDSDPDLNTADTLSILETLVVVNLMGICKVLKLYS